MDHTRDPCPWVILNDFGGAFAMGGIKGFRNSPYGERRIGAISAIKMRAPVLGGNFGVWGGLFSTFDCSVKGIRQKEDPWQATPTLQRTLSELLLIYRRNAIIAGFFTGGSLAIRGGYKAARNGAIGCAVLLAVIEGVGIGFQKMFAGSTKLEMPQPPPSDGAMV
ncbi:Mitochondrial import inner membrane translocase subunit tim17 [Colletotrichum gloeosporioides]|uniref:Mitochondrial import inner membrane translocase subunit tim17 n=1 Tax=Colletotrichum gloeosporioides TaxID=474922 RepID=A0A8H4FNL0_COLGL|nr:Mitochondrial import inner membrane translocase subunit tim17 [Colletotrichum gloeosporioides]KAF3808742.1 Mitochondrial import inner membrane translocase subunit tim17 [Colletotrichum gloeosporioides]